MNGVLPLDRDRITIAILALGGQGGGVLANWILAIAEANGFVAQGTSVPGVAQRTGSTVYYIEMIRRGAPGANRPSPVLAMMPVPGDVDVVIASELMEAGRAILRGFVSERTTLIGSTHRIYAISEKAAPGDGTAASARILDAAERRSRRFVGFDMDAAAAGAGSVISSVMLGALSASDALPFAPEAFEDAIRRGGKAVSTNLAGFAAGRQGAAARPVAEPAPSMPAPTTAAGRRLHARVLAELPEPAHAMALEGVRRLMDYQDAHYADLYLDRLAAVGVPEPEHATLIVALARHLALWMAYEDVIRVADLKVRASRTARVAGEVRLAKDQLLTVTEFMHPRLREVCEALPARLGARILASPRFSRWLAPMFRSGRHVRTTGLGWFLALRLLASMRVLRRSTLRFREEEARIGDWLALVRTAAAVDPALAIEIAAVQGLLKGYGDTFDRGLRNALLILDVSRASIGQPEAAGRVRALREAALADDTCAALDTLVEQQRNAA